MLPTTAYTVTTSADVTDIGGNLVTAIASATFTTGTATDTTGPSVRLVAPANGAAGVPTNVVLQLAFSEPINPLTVNASTFQVYPSATGVPLSGSYSVAADRLSAREEAVDDFRERAVATHGHDQRARVANRPARDLSRIARTGR